MYVYCTEHPKYIALHACLLDDDHFSTFVLLCIVNACVSINPIYMHELTIVQCKIAK